MTGNCITIQESSSSEPLIFNNVWLRDHCCCSQCYNNDTKQRKISFLDIPIDIEPTHYNVTGNFLEITWPDNHQSTYDLAKLSSCTFEKYKASVHASCKRTLWSAKSIQSLPYARVSFPEYLCDENVAKNFVASLVKYGVAFIEKVPPNMLTTELAIKRLFNVHKTFFGEMWAFNDNKAHNDNAYTREFLAAHTDNMYFNDAAGVQALHCLTHTGEGGETLLVDGFNVLNDIKTNHDDVFRRLCKTNIESEYIEDGRHHTYMAPIVKLNSLTQQPEQIRYNAYDRAPMLSIPMSEMTTFYSDMQIFAKKIQSPENEWWFKLHPGTIVFFDNWRILHGRSSYTGNRKMGGGYVSRTEFMSVARTMKLIS
ncbi:Trimethyllysine dioxygenase, mitochondrial, partial [Pseudolycoriella hygida]